MIPLRTDFEPGSGPDFGINSSTTEPASEQGNFNAQAVLWMHSEDVIASAARSRGLRVQILIAADGWAQDSNEGPRNRSSSRADSSFRSPLLRAIH